VGNVNSCAWQVGMGDKTADQPRVFLPRAALNDLIRTLAGEGYTVLGPVVRHNAISLQPIASANELPKGVNDEQDGGHYRLIPGDPELSFEYVVGADSPKSYFFPAKLPLFAFHVDDGRFVLDEGHPSVPRYAMLGVRPCDLAAILVQDRVFGLDDPRMFRCESETWYREARELALLIVVNCTSPSGTCFCASWGTGPEARHGFDLALTELRGGFVVTVGSERGQELIGRLEVRPPSAAELELAELKLQRARERMGRHLETEGIKELLDKNLEHPEWNDVARRCLSCGNCTMACPTCFCCTVTDWTYLDRARVTRVRYWESCYTHQFTHMTVGPERNTIRGRYRHWLRHKMGTWWEQFGTTGCIGCGRCITWCPVGIDVTEEIARIRRSAHPYRDLAAEREPQEVGA
jgi:sulfhydrogenase subunit beta (sulfur reductase)